MAQRRKIIQLMSGDGTNVYALTNDGRVYVHGVGSQKWKEINWPVRDKNGHRLEPQPIEYFFDEEPINLEKIELQERLKETSDSLNRVIHDGADLAVEMSNLQVENERLKGLCEVHESARNRLEDEISELKKNNG